VEREAVCAYEDGVGVWDEKEARYNMRQVAQKNALISQEYILFVAVFLAVLLRLEEPNVSEVWQHADEMAEAGFREANFQIESLLMVFLEVFGL
jgi:hypothetical protein